MKKNLLSLQLREEDFLPVSSDEKQSLVVMRDSVNFWKDGLRRLRKNKIAMVSLIVILLIMIFAYILPSFWPYSYEQQVKYSENLRPCEWGFKENAVIVDMWAKDNGVELVKPAEEMTKEELDDFLTEHEVGFFAKSKYVAPHICGTDKLGRDFAVRLMMGTRISMTVGLICAFLVLLVGATFGAIAGFAGGWVDNIMMRFTDILYTIPDILLIIILQISLTPGLNTLATKPGFLWMDKVGSGLIAIFIVFVLLYWVGMARITRSQVLILKESEFVTAARAMGAGNGRIIRKHLLTNCIGTLIVTTTLQIPSAIFTESYLSFLGLGVAAPMPSLGSLATDAVKGMNTFPHLLLLPALLISVIILVFNLFGDGLRDAFDPKLKN